MPQMRVKHEVKKVKGGLFIGPKVVLEGVDPVMMPVLPVAQHCFKEAGFNCWLTSVVRDDPDSWHGYGRAMDFDADIPLHPDALQAVADAMADRLSDQYPVLFHDGHIHVEHDPGNEGLQAWLQRGWKHVKSEEGNKEARTPRNENAPEERRP